MREPSGCSRHVDHAGCVHRFRAWASTEPIRDGDEDTSVGSSPRRRSRMPMVRSQSRGARTSSTRPKTLSPHHAAAAAAEAWASILRFGSVPQPSDVRFALILSAPRHQSLPVTNSPSFPFRLPYPYGRALVRRSLRGTASCISSHEVKTWPRRYDLFDARGAIESDKARGQWALRPSCNVGEFP